MNLDDFRQKYPQYANVPDQQLADGLYKKFYSSMPRDAFNQKLGINAATPAPTMQNTAPAIKPPSPVDNRQAPPAPQIPVQKNTSGFMGNVVSDVQNRLNQANTARTNQDINPASRALQAFGQYGGLKNDIVAEAGKSLWDMLPVAAKSAITNEPHIKSALSMANTVGDAVNTVMNSDFMKAHPELHDDVVAAANIIGGSPSGKAIGGASKAAGELSGATGLAKGIAAPSEAKQGLILGSMHQKANDTIENLKNSNVKFKAGILDSLKDDLKNHPDLQTAGEAGARDKTNSVVASAIDSIEKGDTSVNNLIGFRDQLSKVIGMGGQDGAAAIKTQKMLDKALDNIPDFKKFQKQWGVYKTGQDVSSAMQLADVSPAKSRAAFQKIVDSDYFSSFDPKVQDLIKTAAKGKATGKFMETIGIMKKLAPNSGKFGKLGSVVPGAEIAGAAALGHPELAGIMAGSYAAGKGGELVQRGLGADVLKYLQENQ